MQNLCRTILFYFRKGNALLKRVGVMALIRAIYFRCKIILLSFKNRHNLKNTGYGKSIKGKPFLSQRIVIFTGVPYDDIGGGQRASQLTRYALKAGLSVEYIYIYPKYNFEKQAYVDSKINILNLNHICIKDFKPSQLLRVCNSSSTIIFELPHPEFLPFLTAANIRGLRTVFELIDNWNSSLGGEWYSEEILEVFIKECQVVTATAKILVERIHKMGRKEVTYLPNAANEYIFDKDRSYQRPADLPNGKLGVYFGSLYGEWFGWEYIHNAAKKNMDINFCLIGDIPPHKRPLDLPINVHFLGSKNIEQLPSYLSVADFCLLPFNPGPISDAVSPIKAFEYIFMAKPVVSTSLLEIRDYPLVYIANNPNEFCKICGELKNSPIQKDETLIEEFISRHSWGTRLGILRDLKGKQNVSVIILIHNNRDIIDHCLNSLLRHCASFISEIIVVDNASDDDGGEYVKNHFDNVIVVTNRINGCASGRNLGVSYATGNYLAFFDSDQWFTNAHGFEEALHMLESDADIGAVGWSAGWFDLKNEHLGGPIVDYLPNRAMNNEAILTGYRTDIAYLGSGGLFMPKTIFKHIGGFDPSYDPTTFEDTDLSFEIKKAGFQLAYRDLSGIRHKAHQTTVASSGSVEYRNLFSVNSNYFRTKWQNFPLFFKEIKS